MITSPSGGQMLLDKGYYNVTGLAWSGAARSSRSMCRSTAGATGATARLETPVLRKALTRFNIDWVWDGEPGDPAKPGDRRAPATCNPQINQLRAVRGTRSIYHNNAIQSWKVAETGEVCNVRVT